ncbi:MAG: nicotinamide riboside transporter PnuC [Myxococcota bacterium]
MDAVATFLAQMSWAEWLGAITGLWCVWLVVKEHPLTWPVGIANNAFWLVLFWRAGLFADALLQVVYAGIAVWGWWKWLHGGEGGGPLRVARAPRPVLVAVGFAVLFGTVVLAGVLATWTPSTAPWRDSLTTCLSLGAQYLMARKLLENWYVWIVADVLYVQLYLDKDLLLTAVVYGVFLTMCLVGLRRWREALA